MAEVKRRRELEEAKEAAKEAAAAKMAAALGLNNNGLIGGPNGHGGLHGANGLGFANGLGGSGADCVFDSMQVEFDVDDDLNMADVEDGNDMVIFFSFNFFLDRYFKNDYLKIFKKYFF